MNAGTQATKRGEFDHLRTLADVVTNFKERYEGVIHGGYDPVVEWCRSAPSLQQAVERACNGRRRDGKMFTMDSCIKETSRQAFRKNLLADIDLIRAVRDFDSLHDVIEVRAVKGIGTLLIYNCTCRIGAFKNLEPKEHVYLHAGPLKGWKALTGTKGSPVRVPLSQVPAALRVLPPALIEDVLCEYRELLNPTFLEG